MENIPEELMINILQYLTPYGELNTSKIVCKQWNRLGKIIEFRRQEDFANGFSDGSITWRTLNNDKKRKTYTSSPLIAPSPRFSHAAKIVHDKMYIFGGCSPTNNAFNDLHEFDLNKEVWSKVITNGLLPAPRECCSVVHYKDRLVLYGGWCQPRRIELTPRFFSDVHIFVLPSKTWIRVNTNSLKLQPNERAGHSSCVVGSRMVMFGGSQRNLRYNDVWSFDLDDYVWSLPLIQGKKPPPRFGHSQFTIGTHHVIVIGGCGGPSMSLHDVWLLDTHEWSWQEILVSNIKQAPPQLWCHPSVIHGCQIFVFSDQRLCQCHCHDDEHHSDDEHMECLDCDTCLRNQPRSDLCTTLQLYILDCGEVLTKGTCSWRSMGPTPSSPPARSLHSVSIGMNEIVIFGGIQNTVNYDSVQTANNKIVRVTADKRKY